jgi:hypothetical protein
MITYKPSALFKPFTVSFNIDTKEEAIAFMNACSTLANVEKNDITNIHSNFDQQSTSADMRMISDKMAVGEQWRELVKMTKP